MSFLGSRTGQAMTQRATDLNGLDVTAVTYRGLGCRCRTGRGRRLRRIVIVVMYGHVFRATNVTVVVGVGVYV